MEKINGTFFSPTLYTDFTCFFLFLWASTFNMHVLLSHRAESTTLKTQPSSSLPVPRHFWGMDTGDGDFLKSSRKKTNKNKTELPLSLSSSFLYLSLLSLSLSLSPLPFSLSLVSLSLSPSSPSLSFSLSPPSSIL